MEPFNEDVLDHPRRLMSIDGSSNVTCEGAVGNQEDARNVGQISSESVETTDYEYVTIIARQQILSEANFKGQYFEPFIRVFLTPFRFQMNKS
jgi:hypothetical protein